MKPETRARLTVVCIIVVSLVVLGIWKWTQVTEPDITTTEVKDWASILANGATVVAIVVGGGWAIVRFNLRSTFTPALDIRVAKDATVQLDRNKIVALRLTIENVSNVAVEIFNAKLAVIFPTEGAKSIDDVFELAKKANAGDNTFYIEEDVRNKRRLFGRDTRWGETKDLTLEAPGLVSSVEDVAPRESDSIVVPYAVPTGCHAVDVCFQVGIGSPLVLFRDRRILEIDASHDRLDTATARRQVKILRVISCCLLSFQLFRVYRNRREA